MAIQKPASTSQMMFSNAFKGAPGLPPAQVA
jgi:hypothetical protein